MTSRIPKKLDLGCGSDKIDGAYGVDMVETPQVDLQQDLNKRDWNLPSDYFNEIYAIDVFEHLSNPIVFIEELYRIATSDAEIRVRGPHASSENWHDPTHKRLLTSRTFDHFSNSTRFDFYSDVEFVVEDVEITFDWTEIPGYQHFASFIANKYTRAYERTMLRNLFPATNIEFLLRPVK